MDFRDYCGSLSPHTMNRWHDSFQRHFRGGDRDLVDFTKSLFNGNRAGPRAVFNDAIGPAHTLYWRLQRPHPDLALRVATTFDLPSEALHVRPSQELFGYGPRLGAFGLGRLVADQFKELERVALTDGEKPSLPPRLIDASSKHLHGMLPDPAATSVLSVFYYLRRTNSLRGETMHSLLTWSRPRTRSIARLQRHHNLDLIPGADKLWLHWYVGQNTNGTPTPFSDQHPWNIRLFHGKGPKTPDALQPYVFAGEAAVGYRDGTPEIGYVTRQPVSLDSDGIVLYNPDGKPMTLSDRGGPDLSHVMLKVLDQLVLPPTAELSLFSPTTPVHPRIAALAAPYTPEVLPGCVTLKRPLFCETLAIGPEDYSVRIGL